MNIKKTPGRRGGAVSQGADEPELQSFTPAELEQAVELLAATEAELGAGADLGEKGAELAVEVDARSPVLAVVYVRALRRTAALAKELGVTAEELEEELRRARALAVLLGELLSWRGATAGSRLVVAAAQGTLWEQLLSGITGELGDASRGVAERAALKSASGEVLLQAEKEQAQLKQRRDQLKTARAAAEVKVREAAARRRRLFAMLALKEGEDIDAAQVDELLSIYDGQLRVAGEEQRKSAR